jgi:translocation and assembly module TamA
MNYLRLMAVLGLTLCSAARAEMSFEISGVSGQEQANVQIYLEAGAYSLSPDASEARIRKMQGRMEKDVLTSLQPFGFYSANVSTEMALHGEDWRVKVSVTPGEPTRWRTLNVQVMGPGSDADAFRKILADLPMKTGQAAVHSQYEQTKTRLRRAASDQGYLDADFQSNELLVDPATGSADVRLIMNTGERFHFGALVIDQDVINDDLLARYVNIQDGEPFSSARLLTAKQALYATDFFSTVDVSADRENAVDGVVPVQISGEKGKRHRYGMGLGYGTDTGYRISGNWTMRRINKSGHNLAFNARYSPITWSFNTAYTIPIGNPALERAIMSAGTIDEDLGDANSKRLYGAATLVKVPGDWQTQSSLGYMNETSNLVVETRQDNYWVPSLRVLRSWSDTRIGPLHGFQILGEMQGSGTGLGLETNFVQANLRAKLIFPVGVRGKLLLRGQAGSTWVGDFDLLPASLRFFAGGDESVRGYGYNTISAPRPDGLSLGGKHLLVGSVEYEHLVKGPWGLAVFTDSGNAFNTLPDSLQTSIGFGLRWKSPVGMVRIDLAQSISDSSRAPRLHISVGPEL